MTENELADTVEGSTAVIETAVDAPEPDEAETDTAEEAVSETEETEESVDVESPDDETATNDDPFAELEPQFWTPDQVKGLRIPKDVKAELNRVTEIAQRSATLLDDFGGEFAVSALKPFASILTKAAATDDELADSLGAMLEANPQVTMQLMMGAAQGVLENPRLADEYFQNEFGKNATRANFQALSDILDEFEATPDKIKELLQYDKAGLLETEYARSEFKTNFAETNLYREMQEKQASLEKKLQEQSELISDPEKLEAFRNKGRDTKSVDRAVQDFDNDFASEIPKVIDAIVDRVKWGDGHLTQLVKDVIVAKLKQSPEYTETVKFIKQTGQYRSGDKKIPLASANQNLLNNRAKALALETVRGVQTHFKAITENVSRNAQIVKKQAQEQAVKKATAPIPSEGLTLEEQVTALQNRFKQQIAASQASQVASQV